MSAAAKRAVLAAISVCLVAAVILAGSAGARSNRPRDRIAPSDPANVHVLVALPSAVVTGWDPSHDNVGVAGYNVYWNHRRATVRSPSYEVSGLDCGQSTTISVSAFDLAGNSSSSVPATVATAACPDTQPPTVPSGFSQAATTQNEVVLTWTPSSDDVGVVGYGVYRNLALMSSPAEPTVTLSGLACGTTYTYAVDAADAAGNRSLFGSAYVQTAACSDGQPPSAPSGLAVTAKTQTSASVAWSPSTDDVGVAGYHVRRDGMIVATSTQPSATVSSLVCGTAYTIGVDAFDVAGNQSTQTSTSVTTDACTPPPPPPPAGDTTPPSQPSGLAVSSTSPTGVSLTWAASSDNVGVAGYAVYVDGSSVSTVTQLGASVSGLTCATTYSFEVDAYDAAGNRSSRAALSAATASCSAPPPPPPPPDTTPPSMPLLSLGPQTQTSLELDWQAGVDNVGIDHYNVWLGHSGSSDFAKVAQVPANQLSYVYQGLSCGTAYTLGLEAVDAAGNKSKIAEAIWGPVSTLTCSSPSPPSSPSGDTTPPSQPANLALQSATRTSVSLTWSASTDNVGVTGYGTYVNNAAGPTSAQPGTTVSNLTCGTAYTFDVDAYDAAGNRSAEASVVGSTAACSDSQPPTAPANVAATSRTATSIALSWSASSDNVGVAGYGLYRGGTQTATTATTNAIFSGLACNTNYTLAVDAYDAAANRSPQTVVMVSTTACPDTTPPSIPANLAASAVSQTGLTLNWSASNDNVGVTGYDVYRNGTKMATATSTSAGQTGLACGTPYAFAVVARDAAGNSSPQAQLSVSTSACSAPPPPSSSGQNLYVSTTGNDSTCVRGDPSKPCLTFRKACSIAQAGDTVGVAAGTYAAQTMKSTDCPNTAPAIVFTSYNGTVNVCDGVQTCTALNLNDGSNNAAPSWLTFQNMNLWGVVSLTGNNSTLGSNITLKNIPHMGAFRISNAPNFVVMNADIGPCWNDADYSPGGGRWCIASQAMDFAQGGRPSSTTMLIDNVTFHDFNKSTVGSHGECLFVLDSVTATIQNSRFYNCHEAGIQVEKITSNASTLTIQNNWFGMIADTGGVNDNRCAGIRFSSNSGGWPTTVIRYNSFAHGTAVTASSGSYPGKVSLIGNLLGRNPNDYCADSDGVVIKSFFSYDYNVWEGADYGAHSQHVSNIGSLYANPAIDSAGDYHLAGAPGSTVADNYVALTAANANLATDREGNTRAAPRDAGSDER